MVRGHGRVDGKGVGCRLGLMGRVGGRLNKGVGVPG